LILPHPRLVELANLYYDIMHFGIIFVFLLWVFLRHRDRYTAIRTTLAITTLACLAIQLIPVAPPRLVGGYVDTAAAYGQSVYQGDLAGQLFAMPSVHVTWAVLVAWYACRITTSKWRFLGVAHAALTVFVVVATANHWWLDGIVGVAVLIICAWARIGVSRAWAACQGRSAVADGSPAPALSGPDQGVAGEPAMSRVTGK
jgi:membrane-associated phospholipid phosphatase